MPKKTRKATRDSDLPPSTNRLCCCPPLARVWIETSSKSIAVENKIEEKRHLETHSAAKSNPSISVDALANAIPAVQVRATTTSSVQPPGGPPVSADSVGAADSNAQADSKSDADAKVDTDSDSDTVIDVVVKKEQGKVYRTDCYTVHWRAEGDGHLLVTLELSGALSQTLQWLEPSGSVTLVRNHLLEPPDYKPMDALVLDAILVVEDCAHQVARHRAASATP